MESLFTDLFGCSTSMRRLGQEQIGQQLQEERGQSAAGSGSFAGGGGDREGVHCASPAMLKFSECHPQCGRTMRGWQGLAGWRNRWQEAGSRSAACMPLPPPRQALLSLAHTRCQLRHTTQTIPQRWTAQRVLANRTGGRAPVHAGPLGWTSGHAPSTLVSNWTSSNTSKNI